jgi:hypothetical protein
MTECGQVLYFFIFVYRSSYKVSDDETTMLGNSDVARSFQNSPCGHCGV